MTNRARLILARSGFRTDKSVAYIFIAWTLALLLSGPVPTHAEDSVPQIAPNAELFSIDNGLQVAVIPDRRAPVVTHMIWYKVGAADEPEGKSGIAHFLEHLMFKGTKNHPEGEFSDFLSAVGGEENAFTTQDYTAYFQRIAKEHLPKVMAYEADRMHNLVLTDAAVIPERSVVLEEEAMRLKGEPWAKLSVAMDAVLFLRHPYGVPVIGWREEIEKLDRADAIAFYDRFYTPNNAVLVLAGDIDTVEARRLVEETYAKVPRRADPPARARPTANKLPASRTVVLKDPKVNQPAVQITWMVPSWRLAAPGQGEALTVLASALGDGPTSLLYQDLVVGKKLASGAGVSYDPNAYDMGTFTAYAIPRENVSLETMKEALFVALARGIERLDEQDITRAKRRLEADTIYAQDSQMAMARIFGVGLVTDQTLEAIKTLPARFRAVTLEDAKRVAATELTPETSVTGFLSKADNAIDRPDQPEKTQ